MNATYFPGANTGVGFVSRFSGIVPREAEQHYTYVLKGGPGVGKSTLMRKVAERAAARGLAVEEFRCASDPDSFDAVRVPALHAVLLDGTAPHSIDPLIPGACDEVVDLGHFLHHAEFMGKADALRALFAENRTHYDRAYACLAAARALAQTAVDAAAASVDLAAVRAYLAPLFAAERAGESRRLFCRSATPKGVVDFADTLGLADCRHFHGAVGAVVLREAANLAEGRAVTLLDDFILPEIPRRVLLPEKGLALCNTEDGADDAIGFLRAPLPDFVAYAAGESRALVARATEELAACLAVHDNIEAIYRPFVDYARVDRESEALFARLGL